MITSAKSWIIQDQFYKGKPTYVVHIKYKNKVRATLEIDKATYIRLMNSDVDTITK